MSLMKWTLAMAGTAIGLRYMSDRHRRRIADGGRRSPQRDRDDTDAARNAADSAGNPWSTPSGTTGGTGTGIAPASGGARLGQDDLLAPDSESAPGSSSGRY